MDRIKEVINSKMIDFRKKLREKILQSLHLSKEQRNELVERLKMLKRKTIDKVLPTGDSIEEINVWSKIADNTIPGRYSSHKGTTKTSYRRHSRHPF
ncbi:hypothetical protein OSTOST_15203 [Ostertagia ostertagi]